MTVEWRVELAPGRIYFGPGSLARLGELVAELGGQRVLVVTDRGIRAAGHVDRAMQTLASSHLEYYVFEEVSENPGERDVAAGVEVARKHQIDFLVGLGGGSAMDCAKGVNFVYTNGGRMEDYWGRAKAKLPMLPSIGLPCTAGTGSEAQSFALISREGDHRKMACGDSKAQFRAVVLDAELAATAPREVIAATGLDALSHALESLVTTARNPFSEMLASEAWRHLDACFESVLAGNSDSTSPHARTAAPEAWGRMLLGAHFAGAAIESSMLGAAHATANPLTATYGLTHGVAIGLMLPATLRFNQDAASSTYRRLAPVGREEQPAEKLARRVEDLRRLAGLPERLRDVGIEEDALDGLAVQAAEQWTARYNPREVGVAEALELYRSAL